MHTGTDTERQTITKATSEELRRTRNNQYSRTNTKERQTAHRQTQRH